MSTEKRILIAFVLSAAIFAVWSVLFPPPKPVKPAEKPAVAGAVEPGPVEKRAEATSPQPEGEDPVDQGTEAIPSEVVAAIGGGPSRIVEFSNDVMNVRLNSRGAAVERLVLRKFTDAQGEDLNLVQTVEHPDRTLPLQLVFGGTPDTRVYAVEEEPGQVTLTWSDGLGQSVVKTIAYRDSGYGLDVSVEVQGTLKPEARLSLGTGMRDTDAFERANRFATWGDVVVATGEDKEEFRREKVDEPVRTSGQDVGYVGFEDTYFISVYRPTIPLTEVAVDRLVLEEVDEKGETIELPVLRLDLKGLDGAFRGEVFAAPKEYDLLKAKGGGLENALHFGIFHPIAVFFLRILRWIHGYAGNWGWSIVLLTIAIRAALFPLMHSSTVSMRRMQKIQPKIKAIQEKYKKNKNDPQVRQKMQQETMALYKEEGVNPVGGCLPMLVQMPILFAMYTLFAHAIELRHAPFIWWITDLSAKDPLYITPVLMTATMWLQQRLAPQAGDPNQAKMMRLMPLIFGIMFLGFPSGLVLYWLTNNVVSIVQQEITLHLVGERKKPGSGRSETKGK